MLPMSVFYPQVVVSNVSARCCTFIRLLTCEESGAAVVVIWFIKNVFAVRRQTGNVCLCPSLLLTRLMIPS